MKDLVKKDCIILTITYDFERPLKTKPHQKQFTNTLISLG